MLTIAAGEIAQDGVFEAAHEAGADDEIASGGAELVADGLLGGGAEAVRVVAGVDPGVRGYAGRRRARGCGLGVVGEDEGDFGREGAGVDGVEQDAEIGAFAGAEDAEAGKADRGFGEGHAGEGGGGGAAGDFREEVDFGADGFEGVRALRDRGCRGCSRRLWQKDGGGWCG